MVKEGVGLRLERSRVQLSSVPLSGNDLGQVVHTHVPLSPSSIIWYSHLAVMSCDWEGNRRSGEMPDLLAVCHRLKWFIHLRAQGLSKGDEHPTNTVHVVWYSLPFFTTSGLETKWRGPILVLALHKFVTYSPETHTGPTALPGPLNWSVKTDQYSDITCRF